MRALLRKVGDNTVSAGDLYAAYLEQMEEQGREPVSRKALGTALERCGQRVTIKVVNRKNIRCRVIRERFMAPEEHDGEEISGWVR